MEPWILAEQYYTKHMHRNACRVKHLAYRMEQSSVAWVKRFILFYNKRHSSEVGPAEVRTWGFCSKIGGRYAAEVEQELIDDDTDWAPDRRCAETRCGSGRSEGWPIGTV